MTDTLRFTTERVEEVDDPVLAELDEVHRAEAEFFAPMGDADSVSEVETNQPYDLEVVHPLAIDVRKLYKRAGKPIPATIDAALGPRIPVLLYQGLTAFTRPAESPRGVWGLGYEVRTVDIDAATVSLSPDTELTRTGSLDSTVRVGVSAAGELAPPDAALSAVSAVPGISLHKAQLEVTTSTELAFAIHMDFSMVKVEAGPIGAGGARWNIYRTDERVVGFQPLIHTILVPRGTRTLKLSVQPWVSRRGIFFGLLGSRRFIPKPRAFEVSLGGLGT
jgi:hypothetical protein